VVVFSVAKKCWAGCLVVRLPSTSFAKQGSPKTNLSSFVVCLCACGVHVAQKQRRNYTVTSLQKRKEFADIQIHISLGASVTAEVS